MSKQSFAAVGLVVSVALAACMGTARPSGTRPQAPLPAVAPFDRAHVADLACRVARAFRSQRCVCFVPGYPVNRDQICRAALDGKPISSGSDVARLIQGTVASLGAGLTVIEPGYGVEHDSDSLKHDCGNMLSGMDFPGRLISAIPERVRGAEPQKVRFSELSTGERAGLLALRDGDRPLLSQMFRVRTIKDSDGLQFRPNLRVEVAFGAYCIAFTDFARIRRLHKLGWYRASSYAIARGPHPGPAARAAAELQKALPQKEMRISGGVMTVASLMDSATPLIPDRRLTVDPRIRSRLLVVTAGRYGLFDLFRAVAMACDVTYTMVLGNIHVAPDDFVREQILLYRALDKSIPTQWKDSAEMLRSSADWRAAAAPFSIDDFEQFRSIAFKDLTVEQKSTILDGLKSLRIDVTEEDRKRLVVRTRLGFDVVTFEGERFCGDTGEVSFLYSDIGSTSLE